MRKMLLIATVASAMLSNVARAEVGEHTPCSSMVESVTNKDKDAIQAFVFYIVGNALQLDAVSTDQGNEPVIKKGMISKFTMSVFFECRAHPAAEIQLAIAKAYFAL
jgi:hypothetical protein